MTVRAVVAFAVLVAFAGLQPANAATVVGAVSRAYGPSEGTVEGVTRVLSAGVPVHLDEVVTTGEGARLEVILDDGTKLTVGENAKVTVDAFVYAPGGNSSLAATVTGAFRYISGALGPGGTRDCTITMPAAVIGVRGTDFWGGPIDGAFGIFLIEGEIVATGAGVEVVMSSSGQGVTMPAIGEPPGDIFMWAQDKIDRAVATVAFP